MDLPRSRQYDLIWTSLTKKLRNQLLIISRTSVLLALAYEVLDNHCSTSTARVSRKVVSDSTLSYLSQIKEVFDIVEVLKSLSGRAKTQASERLRHAWSRDVVSIICT